MYDKNEGCFQIGCTVSITIFIIQLVYSIIDGHLITNIRYAYSVAALFFIVCIIFGRYALKQKSKRSKAERETYTYELKCKKIEEQIEYIKIEYIKKEDKLKADFKNKENALNIERNELNFRINMLLNSKAPFIYSASLYADMKTYIYSESEEHLRYKKHPAITAAEEVKALRCKTHDYIAKYKEMLYKYEFLLKTFPELQRYVDDEEALQYLDKNKAYTELTENIDHVRDYLSDEEYKKLSVDERNQLALDRYKKLPKSNWKIGIEYEMYVDFLLRTKYHFSTIPFGSLKGYNDLGRDIIATKIGASGNISTYIIQCKYWSTKKEIHENVICQIFGTTMEYQLKSNLFNEKVIPVIVTNTALSDMAQKFANKLGVLVWKFQKAEYPAIKCNINTNGNKIYHLPFDQQYYRTEIKKPGEFYAWTVKEATSKGFRRAMRHTV